MDSIRIERLTGKHVEPYLEELAHLRLTVFREYPYLYDGDMAYEADYLRTYSVSPESLFVLVFDGGHVVGASTGVPMADETDEFRQPFAREGFDPDRIFYFGESVLLAPYRGRGLGVRFFAERERYARELGRFDHTAFCAVERPADHPSRPPDYVPLDAFWRKRGYEKTDLITHYPWKDLGDDAMTEKPMVFWIKRLSARK